MTIDSSFYGSVATQGVGAIGRDGSARFRGALYVQTSSPAWVRLNGVALVFEYDIDAQGNGHAANWDWK